MLDQVDVDRLTEILAGKAAPPSSRVSHVVLPRVRLPEPGGRELLRPLRRAARARTSRRAETTQTLSRRRGRRGAERPGDAGSKGPALVVRAGGGRAGETLQARRRAHDDRALARLRRSSSTTSPSRAATRCSSSADGAVHGRGPGQPERHLRQPPAASSSARSRRRRAADRQVPADLPRAMTTTTAAQRTERRERPLRRSARSCRRLQRRSSRTSRSRRSATSRTRACSTPRRTQGGYRLFSEDDVERLETILRLQRDEFLPLRVIREELAAPGAEGAQAAPAGRRSASGRGRIDARRALRARRDQPRARRRSSRSSGCSRRTATGADKRYPETDVDVAAACAQLARFGVAPRHLRTFRTAADREAALLEQLVAPALRSRNPERRAAGLEDLQQLAELAQELSQLLFWRDLREAGRAVSDDRPRARKIREVQDFPTPGVGFKDIMPLLADARGARGRRSRELAEWARAKQAGPRARRRGPRLHPRAPRSPCQARLRLRARAQAGQAAAGDGQRELRARVRRELLELHPDLDPRRARAS